MREKIMAFQCKAATALSKAVTRKRKGIDGIIVAVGLCLIAIAICIFFRKEIEAYISTIVGELTTKSQGILSGT